MSIKCTSITSTHTELSGFYFPEINTGIHLLLDLLCRWLIPGLNARIRLSAGEDSFTQTTYFNRCTFFLPLQPTEQLHRVLKSSHMTRLSQSEQWVGHASRLRANVKVYRSWTSRRSHACWFASPTGSESLVRLLTHTDRKEPGGEGWINFVLLKLHFL